MLVMSYNSRITSQLKGYRNLKSIQRLNLEELQYLQQRGLAPTKEKTQGFWSKCVESFRTNLPRMKEMAEQLFYEPADSQVYEHVE